MTGQAGTPAYRVGGSIIRFALLIVLAVFALTAVSGWTYRQTALSVSGEPIGTLPEAAVVLTGGAGARLEAAGELIQAGIVTHLLVSGVGEVTSDESVMILLGISDHAHQADIDFGRKARTTIGNGRETAIWADRHGYRQILVITSDYHMPRALLELTNAMPDVELIPYAVRAPGAQISETLTSPEAFRRIAPEALKYWAVRMRFWLQPGDEDSEQADSAGDGSDGAALIPADPADPADPEGQKDPLAVEAADARQP